VHRFGDEFGWYRGFDSPQTVSVWGGYFLEEKKYDSDPIERAMAFFTQTRKLNMIRTMFGG